MHSQNNVWEGLSPPDFIVSIKKEGLAPPVHRSYLSGVILFVFHLALLDGSNAEVDTLVLAVIFIAV